ncbi:MAG: hypothetical protein M1816_001235 [Peltula sp. TS41687]|nr:MAG: hypothetical protein M1816_001235 [Peltula sp. TS41687]
MGTRGYYVFYFRGRFYVYYNHYDSYPEGLGTWIIDSIPTDPVGYQEWLETMRAWYEKYDQLLENDLLLFGEDDDEPWNQKLSRAVNLPPPAQCPAPPTERIGFGTTLEILPSPLAYSDVDLYIEWVYIVDLDREKFRVNSSKYMWTFNLNEIPRGDVRWASDIDEVVDEGQDDEDTNKSEDDKEDDDEKEDKNRNERTEDEGIDDRNEEDGNDKRTDDERKDDERTEDGIKGASDAPIDSNQEVKDGTPEISEPEEDLVAQLAGIELAGDKFHIKRTVPKKAVDAQNPMRSHQFLRRSLFHQLAQGYNSILRDHVLYCEPQDFIFREFVFAIISLAAGQFSLLERKSFSSWSPDGLSIYKDGKEGGVDGSTTTFLPAFGRGIHKRQVEAGSAPSGTIYWFENVLVSLHDDGELESAEGVEAAITKILQFARDTGRRSFHGLLLSLWRVVLLRVQSSGVIEVTDRASLLDSTTLRNAFNDPDLPHGGFNAMTYLFQAAMGPGPSQFNAGLLPDDVYHRIIDHTDWRTYRACAKVSRGFERYVKRRIRLGDRSITRLEPYRFDSAHQANRDLLRPGLRVLDGAKRSESEWTILTPGQQNPNYLPQFTEDPADVSQWFPIIGDGDRLSLVDHVSFLLRKVPCPVEDVDEQSIGTNRVD